MRDETSDQPLRLGINSCLLGEKVRYDGGDKLDLPLVEALAERFTLISVCPEVGCGLGTPREAMRLTGDATHPRLLTVETRIDLTGRMAGYCRQRVGEMEREELCGFVFKKNSPSCGLHGVPVHVDGTPALTGRGLFSAEVAKRFPSLPVEEAESLADPAVRERFIERVSSFALSTLPLS